MLIVVTGGSGSGKSAYAEKKVLSFQDPVRYYVATMPCRDEEDHARVKRHQMLRAGKGFCTIERTKDLKGLQLPKNGKARVSVLLECVSNLVANEMFDPDGAGRRAAEEMKHGIDSLLEQCDNLVVVTNEIFSDGVQYPEETMAYLALLGEINRDLFARADEVVEVVCGIPVTICGAGV